MQDDIERLRAALAALETQRATLGDELLALATAPLRQRLDHLLRPPKVQLRPLSVLFVDIVGSTAMIRGLDAEDGMDVMNGAVQRLADIVHAHRGRVLRFTGDGLKAAFGMAEAREDDAEQAVRAGLAMLQAGREHAADIQRRLGVQDFALRVGVHTGLVALGAGAEADATAMGATVNLAARMEQSAPPGALRISHETWNHVRGLFDADAQPPLQVKGVDEALQTYLVRALRSPGDGADRGVERGIEGIHTPLVGRDAELARLHATVAGVTPTGPAQLLTLLGDAGLGKSRLLRELMAALPDCRLLCVRAQPSSALQPWGLLRGLLGAQFGVVDTDSAELARDKVALGLAPWFDERGLAQAQLIGQLAGLDFSASPHVRGLDARALRDQALQALRRFLQALAAKGGAVPVLVVEDLHWADESSLDLLQHLMDHAAELPIALLMSARPALLQARPAWCPAAAQLVLQPLSAAQGGALGAALLQRLDEVPASLMALLVERAEGNPYYMEELVRRLIDDGVLVREGQGPAQRWTLQAQRLSELRLPTTLVGLLVARLDALAGDERQAAQLASVIGHVFWDDALAALDGAAALALPGLLRRALVRGHDSSAVEGTAERQFDHHLLHQVTYDTVLKADRRAGHAAVARWLAERTRDRGAEFLAITGDHAERAGDTTLAADCFEAAAAEAKRRFANAASRSYTERTLALLGESAPLRSAQLLHGLADLADIVGDRAQQRAAHDAMAALLARHPDDKMQAKLLFSRALLADRCGASAESEALALQAADLAVRCGNAKTAAEAQGQLCWLHYARNDFAGARERADAALPWAVQARDSSPETEGKILLLSAIVAMTADDYGQARSALHQVLASGDALGAARLQISALDTLASMENQLGHWDRVAQLAERVLVLAQAIGSQPRVAHALMQRAAAAFARGDFSSVTAGCAEVLGIVRANGDRRTEAAALTQLAQTHRALGAVAQALDCHRQAQAVYQAMGDALNVFNAQAQAALDMATLGDLAAAAAQVNIVLAGMAAAPPSPTASDTIPVRWACQQVLAQVNDARAAPMLTQLFDDMQARVARATAEDDRERMVAALPDYREIAAARRARG
ncbi:MAG: adenylate/guanylate cyclase domain-containing protein [Rubrivivax sp.]|nr:adenylate/guanylate cyclase domain-containing protein [Rubrivivax sp.]